jgi:hypothetical protein
MTTLAHILKRLSPSRRRAIARRSAELIAETQAHQATASDAQVQAAAEKILRERRRPLERFAR